MKGLDTDRVVGKSMRELVSRKSVSLLKKRKLHVSNFRPLWDDVSRTFLPLNLWVYIGT